MGRHQRHQARPRPTDASDALPGRAAVKPPEETPITNRDKDFVQFPLADVTARRATENAFYGGLNPG